MTGSLPPAPDRRRGSAWSCPPQLTADQDHVAGPKSSRKSSPEFFGLSARTTLDPLHLNLAEEVELIDGEGG